MQHDEGDDAHKGHRTRRDGRGQKGANRLQEIQEEGRSQERTRGIPHWVISREGGRKDPRGAPEPQRELRVQGPRPGQGAPHPRLGKGRAGDKGLRPEGARSKQPELPRAGARRVRGEGGSVGSYVSGRKERSKEPALDAQDL